MDSFILLLAMGICSALNFIVIIAKYRKQRYTDATLDLALLGLFCTLFSSGINALCIGMIGSAVISAYLWFKPVYIIKKKTKYSKLTNVRYCQMGKTYKDKEKYYYEHENGIVNTKPKSIKTIKRMFTKRKRNYQKQAYKEYMEVL